MILSGEIPPESQMPLRMAGQSRRIRVAELAIEKALYPGGESIETGALWDWH
jgi:hypothetical protein